LTEEKSLHEQLYELRKALDEMLFPILVAAARGYVKLHIMKPEWVKEKYRKFL